MELKDIINKCDINYKTGDKVKYITTTGVQREGVILQINLILNAVFKFMEGTIEYIVEYDETCYPDRVIEEDIIIGN